MSPRIPVARFLVPQGIGRAWGPLIRHAMAGACIASAYGIAHDQVTYTLSPEYFTRFKFHQFGYANFGWPERAFVAVIGFLATFWVGAIVGWSLVRLRVLAGGPEAAPPLCGPSLRHFALVGGCTLVGSVSGAIYGLWLRASGGYESWLPLTERLGVEDASAFVLVGQIHNFGYVGALVGLVIAGTMAWRSSPSVPDVP